MRFDVRVAFAAAAFALAACSGNFGTGTSMPGNPGMPPMGGQSGQSLPMPAGPNTAGSPMPGTPSTAQNETNDTAVVSLASASSSGFQCPMLNGYSCLLRFNAPQESPSPSPSPKSKRVKAKADQQSPSPSPAPSQSPSPSPSPSSSSLASPLPSDSASDMADPMASGAPVSPAPSATPSGPTMTLKIATQPKDAPAMVHIPSGSLATIPLMDVTLTPSDDFTVSGNVIAQFTLPQEQITNRGFALQLFEVQTHRKKHDYRAVYTFNKSTLQGTTLSFAFTPPKLTVPKGSTYMLVLYGDDHPSATATPASSASPSPSAAPSTSPSASATPGATASP